MATLTTRNLANNMASNQPAKEDVFIDKDGNRVAGGDPNAAFKIASKGVVPDAKLAARYSDAMSAAAPKETSVTKSDAASRKSAGAKKTAD